MVELLAKGTAGSLTPAESEELATLLNAPLMERRVGFVSRRDFAPTDVAARIQAIDLFSRIGEPVDLNLSMGVERVGSWPEAVASCSAVHWENVELEAQNQLTSWLHDYDRENYRKWNQLVIDFKATVINPVTEGQLSPFVAARGLPVEVIHCTQWDLLGALMANAYLPSGHRCFFFMELLEVYEAGHFPCGWNGEWPAGKLVVF
jgi:hypothetical protein